jgi:hypothetical protein
VKPAAEVQCLGEWVALEIARIVPQAGTQLELASIESLSENLLDSFANFAGTCRGRRLGVFSDRQGHRTEIRSKGGRGASVNVQHLPQKRWVGILPGIRRRSDIPLLRRVAHQFLLPLDVLLHVDIRLDPANATLGKYIQEIVPLLRIEPFEMSERFPKRRCWVCGEGMEILPTTRPRSAVEPVVWRLHRP